MSDMPEEVRAIVDLIENGEVDDNLDTISEALADRIARLQESLMKKVRLTFGPNARVVIGDEVAIPSPEPKQQRQIEAGPSRPLAAAESVVNEIDNHPPPPPPGSWPTPITAVQGVGDSLLGVQGQGAEFGPLDGGDSIEVDFGGDE